MKNVKIAKEDKKGIIFQNSFPAREDKNPFCGYGYQEGVLYAHIVWAHTEIFVPPIRVIVKENGENVYPLEQVCEMQLNNEGEPICYKYKDSLSSHI